ncbi:Agamous-like MADS-box protein AGL80 [Euphorbia peplus]|nr:Agamous-like MADS-box protein AGL80 [Euphorbia peplus]
MRQRGFKLELIKKESARKHTFQKRKASLIKKISEITILCRIEACLIIYGPKQNDDEPLKLDTVWPTDSDKLAKIIDKYKNCDKLKKSYTYSDYFADKKRKLDSESTKLHKQINGVKYPSWHSRLDNCSVDELKALVSRLDYKIQLAGEKLNVFRQNHSDAMLHLSENYGNYMAGNNFPVYPHLKKEKNKMPMPMPMHVPVPICFQPGPSWYVSQQQQPQQQQQLQQLFSGQNQMMVLNRGKASEAQLEEENMRNQLVISNVPIWQGQNYVNTTGWKLNNHSDSTFQNMLLSQMVPYHHQLPPPPQHYSGMDRTESIASWSGSNRFNH